MTELVTDLSLDLLKELGSITVKEIQLLVGVEEEVGKLQQNFELVKELLNNAGKIQLTDPRYPSVKKWADMLKDAYYMMDDVLDIWNTAKIKSQILKEEEESADNANAAPLILEKVCSFFSIFISCFHQVDNLLGRHYVGHKIKKLNETLDTILKDKERYGIDLYSRPVVVDRSTTSFDESDIIGRDDMYENDLLKKLLGTDSEKESNPRVISLVGLSGVGKSALARLAYNNMKDHFLITMWVCVSDPFDQFKVAKAIIEGIENKPTSLNTLQDLLKKIYDLIKEKKFFLVLDDVWTENSKMWQPFKNVLTNGAQGSRILVTTRNNNVAKKMGSDIDDTIILGELSPNDCWLIIRKYAFSNHNQEQYEDFEDLGIKLSNKCKGLPVAARALGSHLLGKLSRKKWEEVLGSKLWELEDIENDVFVPLLLSYYELPPIEKQCFLSCAVFPKDYTFNRLELVIHWMAQGYIDSEDNMKIEAKGENYFDNLAMHSFFQDFVKDESDGRIVSCKMHDIVHEFAQFMTKDVCFTIQGDEEDKIDFRRARHLSLIVKQTFPSFVYDMKSLRFLNLSLLSSSSVQPKLFDHLTCLRTLHLEGQCILNIPNEMEKLIHLRYLKLSCYIIKELPESICNLRNLQSLDVFKCIELEKLPQGMGKLADLRHLLMYQILKIYSFPKGIERLSHLRTLSYFPVSSDCSENCKLEDLKNLKHIQGSLLIVGLENVEDSVKVEKTFENMTDLCTLGLIFGKLDMDGPTDRRSELVLNKRSELVLNGLVPPPRLEDLFIGYYSGTTMGLNRMMSMIPLKRFVLQLCTELECLPPLGKLPFLEELEIGGLMTMKKVGDEFLGIEEELESKNKNEKDYQIIFPKLKSLRFCCLQRWEDWIGIGEMREEEEKDNTASVPIIRIMPNLHSLSIVECSKLKSLPNFLVTTPIKKLTIGNCTLLLERYKQETGEDWPKISHIPNIQFSEVDIKEWSTSQRLERFRLLMTPLSMMLIFKGFTDLLNQALST